MEQNAELVNYFRVMIPIMKFSDNKMRGLPFTRP